MKPLRAAAAKTVVMAALLKKYNVQSLGILRDGYKYV
jgi:hypothetical protein